MGLFGLGKKKPEKQINAGTTILGNARAIELPHARPGVRCSGTAYFPDTVAKMPLGETVISFQVKTNAKDFNPPLISAHIFWEGQPIGYMGSVERDDLSRVLQAAAPVGQVFTARAHVDTEIVLDLGRPDGKSQERKHVRALIPSPDKLQEWFQTDPEDRPALDLGSLLASVSLKEQKKYQAALTDLAQKHGHEPFRADIQVETEPSGKYKGQECLLFLTHGVPFGRIGARFKDQHADVFDAVLGKGMRSCEARVRRSDFGANEYYATAALKDSA